MIPKSFRLLGHKIKVEVVPEADWNHPDCVGLYETHKHRILIRAGLSDSLKEHTLHHEMLHAALGAMGHPLNEDENFVDMLAGLLHQMTTTAKYK